MTIKVLGVDLASKRWADVGSALLEFDAGRCVRVEPRWLVGGRPLSPRTLAAQIDDFAREHNVSAVSMDGPQGWREPGAGARPGAGRVCEYQAKTQGKTGEQGTSYPGTQLRWFTFCIDVFQLLLSFEGVRLAKTPAESDPLPGAGQGYLLLECFPTLTWRSLGLEPLPGKAKVRRGAPVAGYAATLWSRLPLPPLAAPLTDHDDLQAVVAALPAAALVAGLGQARALGKPGGWVVTGPDSGYRTEGYIWDLRLPAAVVGEAVSAPPSTTAAQGGDAENPIELDERADEVEDALDRGVRLFGHLVDRANAGQPQGIGYAEFVAHLHQAARFRDVAGRDFLQHTDVGYVLELADEVTAAAGGRKEVRRNGVRIEAAMDTFLWNVAERDRALGAFGNERHPVPYTREQWLAIFPDAERQMPGAF